MMHNITYDDNKDKIYVHNFEYSKLFNYSAIVFTMDVKDLKVWIKEKKR